MGLFDRIFRAKFGITWFSSPDPLVRASLESIPAVVRAINLIAADIGRLPVRVFD